MEVNVHVPWILSRSVFSLSSAVAGVAAKPASRAAASANTARLVMVGSPRLVGREAQAGAWAAYPPAGLRTTGPGLFFVPVRIRDRPVPVPVLEGYLPGARP